MCSIRTNKESNDPFALQRQQDKHDCDQDLTVMDMDEMELKSVSTANLNTILPPAETKFKL
jgi:hypothetical protein